MSVKITYFVHGTTTDNMKDISSGWSDVGLSEKGIKQSIDLKNQIKDKKFDIVFCSDLKRAVDSAKLTFAGEGRVRTDFFGLTGHQLIGATYSNKPKSYGKPARA